MTFTGLKKGWSLSSENSDSHFFSCTSCEQFHQKVIFHLQVFQISIIGRDQMRSICLIFHKKKCKGFIKSQKGIFLFFPFVLILLWSLRFTFWSLGVISNPLLNINMYFLIEGSGTKICLAVLHNSFQIENYILKDFENTLVTRFPHKKIILYRVLHYYKHKNFPESQQDLEYIVE